jgi:hypothetical protein
MLENSWLFPIIQAIHLAGIALFVGTTILDDLRTLGLQIPRDAVGAGWTAAGLTIMLLTGPILFLANVSRYLSNPAFLVKIAVLVLALLFHFSFHRKETRPAALVSMALWTIVVLGGRAIADFDV